MPLALGGKWIVDGAVSLAAAFGMSEAVIGLSVVAVGTSLPELATSAVAAYKRNTDIAVGNVVGSNIFNILMVLGVSSIIKPLPFQPASNGDILMVVVSSVILFGAMFIFRKRHLDQREGMGFLLLYGGYMAYRIING